MAGGIDVGEIEPDVAKAGGKAVLASAPLHNGHSSMIPL